MNPRRRRRIRPRRFTAYWLCAASLPLLVSSAVWAEPTAQERHVDRLAILAEEHKDVTRLLTEALAEEPQDAVKVKSLRINLESLDKEIAYARRQPIYEDHGMEGLGRAAESPSANRVKAGARSGTETPMAYKGWDVFRNFGASTGKGKASE